MSSIYTQPTYIKGVVQGIAFEMAKAARHDGVNLVMVPDHGTAEEIAQQLFFEFPDGQQLKISFEITQLTHVVCQRCNQEIYNDATTSDQSPVWLTTESEDVVCRGADGTADPAPHQVWRKS